MCLILGALTSAFVIPFALAAEKTSTPPAAKPVAKGERAKSLGDALEKANAYSFKTGGIGIIMSYGTKNGVSAEAIGEAFVDEFVRRGEKSRYFYYNTKRDGMALSFRIGYSSMGPWDADTAAANASNVVEMAKAARKVHSQ